MRKQPKFPLELLRKKKEAVNNQEIFINNLLKGDGR